MAPSRAKKTRQSMDSTVQSRSQNVALKSAIRTPEQIAEKMKMQITVAQKQALIDNLQLEITERARKLRAQYALQAQSLRTRIELRINRIPTSLRKANMGELLEKYMEMSEPKQVNAPEATKAVEPVKEHPELQRTIVTSEDAGSAARYKSRGTKRKSDALDHAEKENSSESTHQIPNPKRRTKAARANSRQITNPSTVLSPKSANSRTLPQSPIRPALGSPQKSCVSRPASPLKPYSPAKAVSPAKTGAAVATSALASMVNDRPKSGRPKAGAGLKGNNSKTAKGTGSRTKRGVETVSKLEEVRKVSNSSSLSSSSTGTTIVKNATKAAQAGRKKGLGVDATRKKVAAAAEVPATGRRLLRKR